MLPVIPDPKRGGTYLHCPTGACVHTWLTSRHVGSRFRTLAKYRKHWRARHG
jgi:hypothetical protein